MELGNCKCSKCGVKQGEKGTCLMLVYDMLLCCNCLNLLKEKQNKLARNLLFG